jgi:predicted DNA-binding protein
MRSTTSSYRIQEDLRIRLERAARHLKKGKNWVINRAIEEYLNRIHQDSLAAEARRQSLLASGVVTADEEFWHQQVDAGGWR